MQTFLLEVVQYYCHEWAISRMMLEVHNEAFPVPLVFSEGPFSEGSGVHSILMPFVHPLVQDSKWMQPDFSVDFWIRYFLCFVKVLFNCFSRSTRKALKSIGGTMGSPVNNLPVNSVEFFLKRDISDLQIFFFFLHYYL